ncbi:MAG: Xaa-Pro peptidase family protein [Chloroflexota bacterium]|nr:Xaa-Pro peptidase family protein [Chloroflexota bacterium]
MNFPESEFAGRYERLREELERAEIDALLVTNEANFNYFTGYIAAHPWVSYSRNLIAILPREGSPVLIAPEFLSAEARSESWIERVYPSTDVGAAPIAVVAAALRDLGLHSARIGAELGYEQRLGISLRDFDRLRAEHPRVEFVDASAVIWKLRMRKSAAEVDCLRDACRVTDRALARLFAGMGAGMSERDIARRLGQLLLEEGADRVGWIMMTSGRDQYHRTFGRPRTRVPEPGDMVWLDVSAIVNGYGADFDRAAVVGGPTREQQDLQRAVHEATMAGIEVIRPGVAVGSIVAAVSDALDRAGLQRLEAGRIGHGIGLQSSEPPDVALTDATVLEPGMVITVEPAIVRDHGIYQVEQNVAVTGTGYENLSRSSPELRATPASPVQ